MDSLYKTVKEILDTGRVGTPVFARCVVQVAPGKAQIRDILAAVLTMTGAWMQASPIKIYAQSKEESLHISATVQYMEGQTAIVSVSVVQDAESSLDLMLMGNKGSLYHDAESLPPGFDIAVEPMPIPDWLIDAVKRSLRIGKPTLIREVIGFE